MTDMRFMHLADLHIGKKVNEFSMLEDQKYILGQVLDLAHDKKVDGVLIAGDIYDKTVPSVEAVTLFDSFLTKLSEDDIPVYMISGNHDSVERVSFGARLMRKSISVKYLRIVPYRFPLSVHHEGVRALHNQIPQNNRY